MCLISTMDSSTRECCNPTVSDDIEEELRKVKGDAIGDTLYSERGVLKTLMKLTQCYDKELSEDFETEICLLWDMTLEKDVVDFILKNDFLNMSIEIIRSISDSRLLEILVGIHGNVCCVLKSSYPQNCQDVMLSLMYSSSDPPLLVQLTRLLQAVSFDYLHNHWIERDQNSIRFPALIAFLLTSSTNEELLMSCLELVNTLCRASDDKDLSHLFGTPEMVKGLIESWSQLFGDWSGEDDLPNKSLQNAAYYWTAIASSLSTHQDGCTILCEFGQEVGEIVAKLCSGKIEIEDYLLISCIIVMEAILKVYFNGTAFRNLIKELHAATLEMEDETLDGGKKLDILESFCVSASLIIDQDRLREALAGANENHVLLFWKVVTERQLDTDPGQRVL